MPSRSVRLCSAVAAFAAIAALAPAIASAAPPDQHAAAKGSHVFGDFDGDGRPDLVVGAPGVNRVRVTYSSLKLGGSHTVLVGPNHKSFHYSMRFGSAVTVGDFNNDGYADLAVGAPDYTTKPDPNIGSGVLETRGAVFVFEGSANGLQDQPLAIEGPYDGDDPFNLGEALASADVNGDGRSDLAVTLLGADNGNIRVYNGTHLGLSTTPQQLDDYEATSLAFGDVNADGHPDLVAASTVDLANPSDENYGDLMIFHGTGSGLDPSSPQKIRGDQVGLFGDLGTSVATGDVNGDGIADVVAGAAFDRNIHHASAGTIVLLTGSRHGLKAARHQLVHERSINAGWHDGNGFGSSVDIAKVDGDSFGDVVVGAPQELVGGKKGAGAVYLLHGSTHGIATFARAAHHAVERGCARHHREARTSGRGGVRHQARSRRVHRRGGRRAAAHRTRRAQRHVPRAVRIELGLRHRPHGPDRWHAGGRDPRLQHRLTMYGAVLVHGLWHGGWTWDAVRDRLADAGVVSVAVELPLTSLADDVAATTAALDAFDRPSVLVGHSYGGAVITAAGVHPSVRQLVYVAAFLLDDAESVSRTLPDRDLPDTRLGEALHVDGDLVRLDPATGTDLLYHDATPEAATAAMARIRPVHRAVFRGVPDAFAWRGVPTHYAVCADDRVVHPELQRAMAARAGDSIEWPYGHSAPLVHPDDVAALIVRSAAA